MQADELARTVREEAGLESTDAAEAVTEATLETLGERVTDGQAEELAADLPDEFAGPLADPSVGEAEAFGLEAFLGTVGRRAGLESTRDAREATAATLAVLHERVATGELRKLRTYLPDELEFPVEPPDGPEAFPASEFVRRLAELLEVDEPTARRRARAVLSTVAAAASDPEIRNVRSQLPAEYDALFDPPDGDEAGG